MLWSNCNCSLCLYGAQSVIYNAFSLDQFHFSMNCLYSREMFQSIFIILHFYIGIKINYNTRTGTRTSQVPGTIY